MVPRANSNACRSASTSTPVSIPGVPSISTCSVPSSVAVSSSSSLALIRSRYEATGFSYLLLRTSSKLLVSYISPHKAISSQSVSRWLYKALRLAGIELGYSGHSTRGASTSAAAAAGLSVELILEAADWASAQTFERFYHKEQSSGAFARAVLSG